MDGPSASLLLSDISQCEIAKRQTFTQAKLLSDFPDSEAMRLYPGYDAIYSSAFLETNKRTLEWLLNLSCLKSQLYG